ncbi:MAG: sulfotransferase [Myxococcota bacterium]|nr:sulfotransferase [Myxococcota bacterium]
MAQRTVLDRIKRRVRWHVTEPFEAKVKAPARGFLNGQRTYQPIFVAGASGSGTSLLALSLGKSLDCAGVIYETNFQVARSSPLYVPDIDEFESVAAYQEFMTPKADWTVESGRRDLLDCYRRYCWGSSRVVVDKGPDINLLRAGYLMQCFPDGWLVLIYRDPVANVEGLRRKWKTFGSDPLSETIRFWREIHEAFLDAAAEHPDRSIVLEYEALVEAPDAALAALRERMGMGAARGDRKLIESPNVEGMGIRNVKGNQIGYVTDANRRSRERLAPGEAEEIESALADLVERLKRYPDAIDRDHLSA